MDDLQEFLSQKPLYYKEIDYSRMPRIWRRIKEAFSLPPIIHIVGTNGKGSTGRFLAYYLWRKKNRVGHYTSPHVLRFNERIWIDGADSDDRQLEEVHRRLLQILTPEEAHALSYFEYTTLLAMLSFEGCDYAIVEAGLGGEYDATAVLPKELTLVTPIGFDHRAFLGETIEEIARTKLNAVQKFAIIAHQPYSRVYKAARAVSRERGVEFFRVEHFYTTEEAKEAAKLIAHKGLPSVFADNLLLALAGAKFFGYAIDFSVIDGIELFGRAQRIAPNIWIDVGHNPLAAQALKAFFQGRRLTLVYNTYADKEYRNILTILKPVVQKVEILPIYGQRVASKEALTAAIESVGLPWGEFHGIQKKSDYLVFGSFAVVERFLTLYGANTKR